MKNYSTAHPAAETAQTAAATARIWISRLLPDTGRRTEVKCAVLTIFPAPNQKEYIALLPLDENGENEDGEVYLYRYYEENGQPNLDNIDSDEEYEIAADAFDELMDTEQFNEMEENSTEE